AAYSIKAGSWKFHLVISHARKGFKVIPGNFLRATFTQSLPLLEMPSAGCGNCRVRKVRCDQTVPKCNRCVKLGVQCQGYGLRLSWPRRNDRRRAIVGPNPKAARSKDHVLGFTADMMHETFPEPLSSGYSEKQEGLLLLLKSPSVGAIAQLSSSDVSSVQYFIERASYSISGFGQDAQRIPEIVTRMALSDVTLSSAAVLKSVIALASFHRGNKANSMTRPKAAALRALSESTQGLIGITESACHIAAGIILCTLEIQQNATKTSHWLWYACGAAKIIKASALDEMKIDRDLTALVGWVHYLNTIAKFGLRHWKPDFTLEADSAASIDFDTFHPAGFTDTF
ncbi:unnamed protein product, partial [Fusarium equiseti]